MLARRRMLLVTALICGAATHVREAQAQTARSGGGAASAQLMQQLQELASARTTLEAENAKLKRQLDDMRKERDSLKAAQQKRDAREKASAAELARSDAQRESVEQELKRNKDQTEQLIGKFRETIQTLRDTETGRATAQQALATREQELKVCIDRNLALYKINGEVLDRLERQSLWTRVEASEPFTRLKRTQLENLVDDYKIRADDQRATQENLKARAGSPPAPPPNSTRPAAPSPASPDNR